MSGDFEIIVTGNRLGSLQAVSPAARRWVKANLPGHADPGAAIVGDEGYLGEILDRLTAAGLSIRGPEHGSEVPTMTTNAANCTDDSGCPVFVNPPRFVVKATAEFHGPHRIVAPGDFVVIDPDAAPQDGSVVLIGSTLERWQGQPAIRGVAVEWMTVARL